MSFFRPGDCTTQFLRGCTPILGITQSKSKKKSKLKSSLYTTVTLVIECGGIRTPDRRLWRPLLYQLSYTPIPNDANDKPATPIMERGWQRLYRMISETVPAPIVRPPSLIAKRIPFSIATGAISLTTISTLSPGITISTP